MPGLFDDLIPNPTVDRVSRGILGEEKGTPKSVSPQGARGVGQIEPGTFKQYALPGENIDSDKDNRAVHRRMIYDFVVHKKMDPGQAATAYFSGEGNVARDGGTPWKQNRGDVNEDTASYVAHAERGMKPARRLFDDLIPKGATPPKKGLFDDLIPKQEPWRVPKANEGQIVHAKRGEPPQGPQRDPGVVDPEIEARLAPQIAANNRKHPLWTQVAKGMVHGAEVVHALQRMGSDLASDYYDKFKVFGDVASGKTSLNDPATQRRVEEAGVLFGAMEVPGGESSLVGAGPKASAARAAKAGPEAVEKALGENLPVDKSDTILAPAKPYVHPTVEIGPAEPNRTSMDARSRWVRYAQPKGLFEDGATLDLNKGRPGTTGAAPTAEAGAPKEIPVDKSAPSAFTPQEIKDRFNAAQQPGTGRAPERTPIEQAATDATFQLPAKKIGSTPANEQGQSLGESAVENALTVSESPGPESVGAAQTPLSQIVEHNLKTFADDNAKTPGFKESLRAAINKIKQFVAPETIKDTLTGEKTGARAAEIIRNNEGNENRTAIQAGAAIDKYSKFTGSLNLDEQLSMIKWMQSAEDKKPFDISGHPEAAGFANTFKKWMLKYEEKLRALPDLQQMEFRKNFVHQMWMRPDSAMSKLFGPGRTGSSGFTKQHWYDDYEEGIRAGEAPFSTNPMEIFKRYVENAAKFIADKEIIQDGKDADLIRQLPAGAIPQPGWEAINSWSAPGTQLYAPEGFAKVFNSRASPPPNDLLRSVQFVTNKIAMTKLFWSGFHAALETKVAWASGLGDAMTKLARGDLIGSALQLGKTPFKPFTSYSAARKAWKTFKDDEWGDPTTRRIVQGLTDANFDFMREGHLADEYRASRLPGFIKSFQKGLLKTQARDAFAHIKEKPVTGMISEIYDLGMRSAATVMEPTFQYYVPWLKTQAAVDAARTALEARPNMTRAEFAKECIKIADNMDARFGEMNRNNIFWSQTLKAIAQSSALSYSYVYGIAKNAIGTGFDVAKIPSRAYLKARGMSNEMIWTDRMSFMIAMPIVAVTSNAIYQYLMTGNAPQTLDQAMQKPKTGGTVEGQPERAVIPGHENSYINFFRAPLHDAFDKLNPLWQTLIDLGEDKDYRDKQIWNPQDPMVKRILDSAKFAAAEMGEPVTFEREVDKKAGTNIGGLQTAVGIGSAGMRDTNPEKFNQMMNYKDSEAKFEAQEAAINDRLVRIGKPRLRMSNNPFHHPNKQDYIRAIMQGKDPLAAYDTGYGGTQ